MNLTFQDPRVKLSGLLTAVVFVFGITAWRIVAAIDPSPAPAKKTEVASGTTTTATPISLSIAATSAPAKTEGLIQLPPANPPPTVDPFQSIQPDVSAPTPAPPPPLSGHLGTVANSKVSPEPIHPIVATPEPIAMRVSGIVYGRKASAVVEVGAKSLVVRKGSRLPNGAIVVGIDASSVTLKQGGKTISFSVDE